MEGKCSNHKYFNLVEGQLKCSVCNQPPEGAIEDKKLQRIAEPEVRRMAHVRMKKG